MRSPTTVDGYIAHAPKKVQGILKELRAIIRSTAPDAAERMSYGMPYYHHYGRLAYFSHWSTHIGLYIPTPIIEKHKRELTAYKTQKATVHFPLDRRLPVTLIRKLIRARMNMNEMKKKK